MNTPSMPLLLSESIFSETGEHLSRNTLARLLGLYPEDVDPRRGTLDIIAKYLGYESFEELDQIILKGNSSFLPDEDVEDVLSDQLPVGSTVVLTYKPDRELTLLYKGEEVYTVTKSVNSKLRNGDICVIRQFLQGYPLQVLQVKRGDVCLGRFTAGERQGGINIKEIY